MKQTVGQRLRKLREEYHKLTQRELAEEIGSTQKSVVDWEGDVYLPNPKHLKGLSTKLGVTVDYLLAGSKEPWRKDRRSGTLKPPRSARLR